MRLRFLYHPVTDLAEAVAFYRDTLGWDESWRMGDTTAAMAIPDSETPVMLDAVDDRNGPSGFFEVDDVDAFYARHSDRIHFEGPPVDVPPVRYLGFRDPAGNLIRLFSQPDETSGA